MQDARDLPSLLALVALQLVVGLPFLTRFIAVQMDEPWYAGTAYGVLTGVGAVNQSVGDGGGENFFLYPYALGLWFQAFGTTLLAGRLLSVLAGAVAVAGLVRILQRLGMGRAVVWLAATAWIVSNLNFLAFRVVRPEAFGVALLIWGVYGFVRARTGGGLGSGVLSGVLCGLASLCHPVFVLPVGLLALFVLLDGIGRRDWRPVLAHGVPLAGLACLMVAYLEWVAGTGLSGLLEISADRTVAGSHPGREGGLSGIADNVAHFVGRYSVGFRRAYAAAFVAFIAGWGLTRIRRRPDAFVFSLVPLVSLALALVFLRPFKPRAFVPLEWFLIVPLAFFVQESLRAVGARRWLGLGASLLFVANNVAGDAYVAWRDRGLTRYGEIERQLAEWIPAGSTVCSPLELWFGMSGSRVYSQFTRWDYVPADSLEDLIDSGALDTVVLTGTEDRFVGGSTGVLVPTGTERRLARLMTACGEHARDRGRRVATIPTRGYGRLEVWRIESPGSGAIKPSPTPGIASGPPSPAR